MRRDLILLTLLLLALALAGGLDRASAYATPEGQPQPERHCYAVLHRLGSKPFEVPCPGSPAPVEEAPAPEPEACPPPAPPPPRHHHPRRNVRRFQVGHPLRERAGAR